MSDVTIRQLASMPVRDLIRGLENEEFSVLKAAHSAKLRAEMRGTGLICRAGKRAGGRYQDVSQYSQDAQKTGEYAGLGCAVQDYRQTRA